MSTIGSLAGWLIDLFRKRRSRKPVLDIHGQQPGDFLEPHQMLTLSLKNRDEDYAITLREVYVKPPSQLRIKVLQKSAAGSGSYPDSGRPFSASEMVNMALPSGQVRRFMILFSNAGRRTETHDSIALKVSYNRPRNFHMTAKPIILRIAVDANMQASIH